MDYIDWTLVIQVISMVLLASVHRTVWIIQRMIRGEIRKHEERCANYAPSGNPGAPVVAPSPPGRAGGGG